MALTAQLHTTTSQRKGFNSYVKILSHMIQQYRTVMAIDRHKIRFEDGKLILETIIINIGELTITNDIAHGWTSLTVPKISAIKELYFFIACDESTQITFNPIITKGGWISGTFCFNVNEFAFNIFGTEITLHLHLFVPCPYPDIVVCFDIITSAETLGISEYGSLQIIPKTNNTYIGILKDLKWFRQYTTISG